MADLADERADAHAASTAADDDDEHHYAAASSSSALPDVTLVRAMMPQTAALTLFPLNNYLRGKKEAHFEKDASVRERFIRMESLYAQEGMKRTVDAVLLVHIHNHPHILLMQIGERNSFFKLPGGKVKPGEDDISGLKRKLTKRLGMDGQPVDWEVSDLVATWWRPNFEQSMYPYCPPHCTQPKECKKIFLVSLPQECAFAVPRNYTLVAVPLFEIYDNIERYGNIIGNLPVQLARFQFNCIGRS